MTDYGEDFEDTHESMHMRRRERHYNGHKLARAIGHNQKIRKEGGEAKSRNSTSNTTSNLGRAGELEQG